MRYLAALFLAFFYLGAPAFAEEMAVAEGLVLNYTLEPGWELVTTAPEALVAEIAEHIGHEAEAQGQHPSAEQITRAAQKRLAANEAIIYHPASNSHLDIDFSPLEEHEQAPSSKTLRRSAEFALQSLEGEEGVHKVKSSVTETKVFGAREAYRLDATYMHHDEPVTFIGIIGFVEPSWFFFYFTAPGQDPAALQGIESILANLKIKQP